MSVASKLHQVYQKVCYLDKDKKLEGGQRYRYLSEEKTVGELHEAFAEVGLVIIPVDYELIENRTDQTKNGVSMFNTRVKAKFALIDPDDNDRIEICTFGEGSDMGDKTLNKCMTAAYKYALRQSCMIASGCDPDDVPSNESEYRGGGSRTAVDSKDLFCHHDGCGVELTQGQMQYSINKFSKPLCPTHQKTAQEQGQPQPQEQANPTAEQNQQPPQEEVDTFQDNVPECADCHQPIKRATMGTGPNRREYDAHEIAVITKNQWNTELCAKCAQTRYKATAGK